MGGVWAVRLPGVLGPVRQLVQVGVAGAGVGVGLAGTVAGPLTRTGNEVARGALDLARTVGDTAAGWVGAAPRSSVAWLGERRWHVDLEPLLPFPGWVERAGELERAAAGVAGVRSAHVETGLGRLVVDHDGTVDRDELWERVCGQVSKEQRAGAQEQVRARPFADPGDPLALMMPLTTAAMDVAAIGLAITGRLGRLPVLPRTVRAAAAVVNHQPRVVAALESRLGRIGTDLLLSASTAASHGLGRSVGAPALDLLQRGLQVSEAAAHRATWREREPELASPVRPQTPVVPVVSAVGADLQDAQHNWAVATVGELSHVAVDAAIDSAKDEITGLVEDYAAQAANGSLIAAAGALLAGGGAEEAADAVLAGVPKAAHLGREAFAAMLGRGLAADGDLVLDPGALRRLDRIRVVVIDGAALRGDTRAVLKAEGNAPGWDADRVYEVADALLHGEQAPGPDPDELPAEGARLRWRRGRTASATPAAGVEHAALVVDGEEVGTVEVGWEIDPFAVPLLQTARRTGLRVVLRHVAGTEELASSVAAAYPPGTPLLPLVRDLRDDRGPVLLVTALHPDFASADTLAALAVANVGVALDDPRAATPWSADIITGDDLAAVVRLLAAIPAARRVSESSVRLAQGGSTLAGLLLVTGESRRSGWSFGRVLGPVHAAGASALLAGAWQAQTVLRMPPPQPQPLTAWHALDAEIVYARLDGAEPPVEPAVPLWQRRLADVSDSAVVAPLRPPLRMLSRLAAATRAELDDPLTPILAVGAAASAILGSNVDAVLVGGVMAVNAVVGGVQRLRADSAVAALFAQQDPRARRVVVPAVATTRRRLEAARRGGRIVSVPASRLSPGDVIELRAPDVVPADARLLCMEDLEVDESLLTGESVPVAKHVDPVSAEAESDRASMVFEGSTIVAGQARAIVVATGAATAARRATENVAGVETAAGIQERLRELTGKVLPLTLAGGAAVSGLALLRRVPLRRAVADGVAIAVAAVPEGLPLVATLAQLAAARRLSDRGVLVRAPRTLEAVGRVQTVCFDKTGTLTQNRLRLVAAVAAGESADDEQDNRIIRAAARACPQPADGQGHAHATDEAVLTAAHALEGEARWETLAEVPFESSRGYAAAIGHPAGENNSPTAVLAIKGAPEIILARCRFADPSDLRHAEKLVETLAGRGQRVLAVAQCAWPQPVPAEVDAELVDEAARDLELLGFVGLADTPRASARPLIEELLAAGREVVLITGDHPITAAAIAHQLGLPCGSRIVTGSELAGLDERERTETITAAKVFARVTPEQKLQVISALQSSGRVTAMVGDGANDAAAIRMADVGVGINARGSSAARHAADLVLTRDDLTALLDALVEGRNMWRSVRDALTILLGGNAGEVAFTVLGTALGRGRAPVGTRQLLLVNLLTDMFPALAVAVTPDQRAQHPEEDPQEALRAYRREVLSAPAPSLDRPLLQQIVTRGTATALGASAAWAIGRWTPGTTRRASTMGLVALVGTQLSQTMLTRSRSPLVAATAVGSAAVLVAIVQTPVVSHFFGCTPLGPVAWTAVLGSIGGATAVAAFAPGLLPQAAPASPEQ
ncbi:cation-translocating P-type ATPase [Nocardia yunnanensis]|uniref:Probable cation-transporting ATPase I n=1 Tax=Nocardia yunnanensis TaxID=2382165 RepID=A0A386ZJR1_9NOCA|nr:cation-translocating P-type ATPase [Nocardia yunnanensis]AYF78112.1 cation-translocating P-type ATPase [Nocardia yunnanensis]